MSIGALIKFLFSRSFLIRGLTKTSANRVKTVNDNVSESVSPQVPEVQAEDLDRYFSLAQISKQPPYKPKIWIVILAWHKSQSNPLQSQQLPIEFKLDRINLDRKSTRLNSSHAQ